MGSDIHLVVVEGRPDCFVAARARIEELEARWSRFRPESEISRLNTSAGDWLDVSDDTVLLLQHAAQAWRLTGGSFDPTMLDALRGAGYDRSFDDLPVDRAMRDDDESDASARLLPSFLPFDRPSCLDIEIDGHRVRFPVGMGFDPGGIGKGLAADLVAIDVLSSGAAGVCVNMGGDLRVAGTGPDGAGWTLAIDHPWASTPIALVGLTGGAVATSTVLRRVWTVDGERRHHLLDPSTGQPSTTDLALAAVVAGTAWQAEVLAKAALLRGRGRAFDLLEASMASLTVDHDGVVECSGTFAAFTGGAQPPSPVVFDLPHQP
jgi:thiamine biosynthesis lipoprotein